MQPVEIEELCWKVLMHRFGLLREDIEKDPWDRIIGEFAARKDLEKWAQEYVIQDFSALVDKTNIKLGLDLRRPPNYSEAMQRHHDYYMCLYYLGLVTGDDYDQYAFAQRREANGEVTLFPWKKKAKYIVSGWWRRFWS